ncbi:hypothetical protein Slin14017_G125170 [Septoria linicola]|nr:hypothetical protein Slin14017_G125170 [Septoria linicola]
MKGAADRLPQELLDIVRQHLTSDIVTERADIMQKVRDGVGVKDYIDNIDAQMNTMFRVIEKANKHFWPALVDPGRHLSAQPEFMRYGSVEELQVQLRHAYEAWEETPGAIDWVRQKLTQ